MNRPRKKNIEEDISNPQFRKQIRRAKFSLENNRWLNMCNPYSLIKHGLISEEPFMDVYSARILRAWDIIRPVFATARRNGDPSLWENFEYLVVRAHRCEQMYPRGLPQRCASSPIQGRLAYR